MNINWDNIPTHPGVYIWKAADDQVIYVGKAKNLRARMKQYFAKDLTPKNKLLLANIKDFDYQVTASELDALLLEENLINEYEPRFNLKIKSARKYPYIELKRGRNIKLSVSKTLKFNKGASYYGPFPDGFGAKKIIKLLSAAFPLDVCLAPNTNQPCLNYQMGRCMGQCTGEDNIHLKDFVVNGVEDFFKGNTKYVEEKIEERIEANNKLLNFEESQQLKENLDFINKLNEQKSNTFKDTKHRDILNYYVEDGIISISLMFVRFGTVSLTSNFINKRFNPDPKDSLESFIHRFYKKNMIPDELILPFELEWEGSQDIKMTIPKSGTKKELLDVVEKHATDKYVTNIGGYMQKIEGYEQALTFIKANLGEKAINTIEMVDISSTQGAEQVGAVVRFDYGEPNKSKYRKYIIKTVDKMDDYASTEEVIWRHFSRMVEEKRKLPDMFIVDGKHQLTNAKKILAELGIEDVLLCGLIKDDKHDTDAIINANGEVSTLDREAHMYKFMNRIQEEVHRFVIHFHRSRRQKTILESKLDDFTFLTEVDRQNMFREFKSIRKIMTATDTELRKVLSESKVQKFIKERNNG